MDLSSLATKDKDSLSTIAKTLGITSISKMKKAELIEAIVKAQPDKSNTEAGSKALSGIRSRRASTVQADSIEALVGEQEKIAGSQEAEEYAPRPMRRRSASEEVGEKNSSSSHRSSSIGTTELHSDSKMNSSKPQRGNSSSSNNKNDNDEDDNSSRRRRRRGSKEGNDSSYSSRENAEPIPCEGLIEIREDGYGFLRCSGYLPSKGDAYVSVQMIRRNFLRKGDHIVGLMRPASEDDRKPTPLLEISLVNSKPVEEAKNRRKFEDLTPLFPDEVLKMQLDSDPSAITGRIIDLVSPIGKGQRGLIVSPPKAGKTTIMKEIVSSIEFNNPEVHLMVLLVDERPEEVTDMKRHCANGEVVASTFDRPPEEHTRVAELTIERAKRLVEQGRDVVVILDGITRLARAYNLAAPVSGRILSGGVDSQALYPPKKFFGAARNIEEGGSLTIIATALVDTGSKMDEVIFEEFKGTGNMELRLDRRVAERRIFPAIDVDTSSTRHEELLFDRSQLNAVWKLRRVLHALEGGDNGRIGAGLELLLEKLKQTKNNDEFLAEIAKNPA
ncbi:MAG: transcription termination factor Rho [Acidimicrobiia bacterium]|nr:transcription termination factor Rho [Acidimicrobiia bacterium]